MFSTFHQAPIGAELWIDLPIGRHFGRKFSHNKIIHFSKKHKEIRTDDVAEFSEGRPLFCNASGKLPTQQEMYMTAEKLKGTGYSLIGNNCEHFKEILGGNPPSSRQVQGTIGCAATGLGIARLSGCGPLGLVCGLIIGATIGLSIANR